jgi:flagellar hook-associated protein 2
MINSIRMSGLVSGLDTDSIVKNLMKAESAKLNKLLQKKQTEEWKRDQYREMNSLLLDLRNATSNMRLQSTYMKKSLASDNDSIVTATQKGIPNSDIYNVTVSTLPKAAQTASVKFNADSSVTDNNTALGEEYNLTINDLKVEIKATDTLNDIISKVNAKTAETGVVANLVQEQGQKSITFTTKAAGEDSKIDIKVKTATEDEADAVDYVSSKLGLASVTIDKDTISSSFSYQKPSNGEAGSATINGITYAISGSSFTFDGVEFNIKSTGTTQIKLKADEDAIFNSIKSYVEKYNEVIGKINTKLSETIYRDYKPLLDEEKESLSEKQIDLWESKAKSGLLKQDPILSGILSQMRTSLSSQLKGTGINDKVDTLSEIGITTGYYSDQGKLQIDETKLRKAIAENGSDVMALFTKTSTATDPTVKQSESGLAQRLYTQLTTVMSKLTEKAGSSASLTDNSTIGLGLTRLSKEISSWEYRLEKIEDRYWKKFTAMETAMSRANSQSSWLSQYTTSG